MRGIGRIVALTAILETLVTLSIFLLSLEREAGAEELDAS